jgi:pantoate--beta-alanine ligase
MPNIQKQKPRTVTDGGQLRREVLSWRAAGQKVGLVPTMGALHAGHLSLVERSNAECDRTVVTIFVNPTQFGPTEDFARYPRDLAADTALLADVGADLVFAPSVEAIYPAGHVTSVEVQDVSRQWEGAVRPTHFRGVATIVLKLFNLAPADVAYFGQKDYQQTVVIRRMVADLDVPIEICVCPTVRESDGLALSSRNAYLSPDERRRGLVLSQCLQVAKAAIASGERDPQAVVAAMKVLFQQAPGVTLDYAALVDPDTMEKVNQMAGRVVAIVAARVGTTRLIDNEIIKVGP